MKARSMFMLGIVAALGTSSAPAQVASPAAGRGESDREKATAAQAETRGVVTGGGRVVFIDPATGKVRQPDAAEIGRLLPPAAAKVVVSPPLTTKTGPGGAVGVVLDDSFDSFTIVTKKPDGTLAMDCVTGEKKAAEALTKGVKANGKTAAHETLDVR